MKKQQYLKMRQTPTTEPTSFEVPASLQGTYCVQEHHAKRAGFHEDFRFEFNGVAISWAIPKGLPRLGDKTRIGIKTEDHPVAYMAWEGVIPDGSYGAGTVKLVDKGKCEIIELSDEKVKVRLTEGSRAGVYSLSLSEGNKWFIVHKTTEK